MSLSSFFRMAVPSAVGLLALQCSPVFAAEVVQAGAGSYLKGLPEGAKGPPGEIFATGEVRGPMPTNDWWSSLAWLPFSEAMFPHPLAMKAGPAGLTVWHPGAALVASRPAIMGGGGEDIILGHTGAEPFADARVAGWSDWFVTAQFGGPDRGMRLTFGHGSPFVFAEFAGGEPVVTVAPGAVFFAGDGSGPVVGVRVGAKAYGLFAPGGSTWEGVGSSRLVARTGGKGHFSLALLPDTEPETLELFRRHAFSHVTGSRVSWTYDEKRAVAGTVFEFETEAREGADAGTLFALYPHQWRQAEAEFTGHAYPSVRGPMKLAAGRRFTTEASLPPVLPALPLTKSGDRATLKKLLAADLAGEPQMTGDTYWLGKQLGKWAALLPLAELAGEAGAAAECGRRIRTVLEGFLTAADESGAPKPAKAGVFAYEEKWGTLIGYPASYGSDDQLNDHHFHYGYFLRAAGEIARRDPEWARRWGPMLRMLIRDIASDDRNDAMFPFLRCFDPYAGHTWASGHAKFPDGNNNESSSEAVNAWAGLMLLGEATGDKALRDLAAWLLSTEVAAIEDYWFDVRDDLHPPDYEPSVVTMVWGAKGANGTWFSPNPELVHGINFLPVTGASLYLGRWPDYARKNYEAMVRENLEADTAAAAAKNLPPPAHDGTGFDQWADILWMYRALSDPADAMRMWKGRPADFEYEAGNTAALTYAWIAALGDLGQVDRSVSADAPFAAVFSKDGRRTHVAWNLGANSRTVTFSDGMKVVCPPGKPAMR